MTRGDTVNQQNADQPEAANNGKLDLMANMRLLYQQGQAHKNKVFAAILFATLSALLEMVPIWLIYELVMAVAMTGGLISEAALISAFGIASSVIFSFLLFAIATGLSHRAAYGLLYDLRMALARQIAKLPLGFFLNWRGGQAKHVIVSDPERLEILIAHAIPEGVSAIVAWLFFSVWLFIADWRMALATIILTPIAAYFMGLATSRSFQGMQKIQQVNEEANAAIVEFVSAIPVLKVYDQTGQDHSHATDSIQDLAVLQSQVGRGFVPLGSPFFALILTNITVISIVGLVMLQADWISLSIFILFMVVGVHYNAPLMRLFELFHHFSSISVTIKSTSNILAKKIQPDCPGSTELRHHDISFENVSFAYDQTDILKDIHFTAKEGTITAIVGASGSGKTTLARLIPRFYDIQKGEITLGGVNIQDISLNSLMDQIAFVFQDPFLFSQSIGDNIRFGRKGTDEAAIKKAATCAQADQFINDLPDGYQTEIGFGHQQLSGGEKQRITLARTIIKDAPIIILDEATAYTDPDCEAEIQQAIMALSAGKTLIVIAHRLHTIIHADQILMMDQGRIIERGTHQQLLDLNGSYASLWQAYMTSHAIKLRDMSEERAD